MFRRILKTLGLGVVLLCILIFFINLGINIYARPYMVGRISDVPFAETVLIPGAAVSKEGKLSPLFLDRVNSAIELYEAKRVSKILVSGDNSTRSYNEVSPVRLYLLSQGIPDEDIYLDYAGFDTYSSMYRAREVFEVTSVVISTQSFHLPRAVFIARMLGLNATGIRSDTEPVFFRNYVREIFANEKAVLDLLMHRTPKFLGEEVPISGKAQEKEDDI